METKFLGKIRSIAVASDPSFSRLRMATRVTLTLIVNVGALVLVHGFLPLSVGAYGIAMITAMQGALQIKDTMAGQRLVTRVYCAAAGFGAATVAALLANIPVVADAAFIVLVFGAVYARKYGVRWNAVGMFAFMCYFISSYLRPSVADLPGVAISIVLSGAIASLIRLIVLPERPEEEFRRAALALFQRIDTLKQILTSAQHHGWTEARRTSAQEAQDRIREALLIADSYLPIGGEETATDEPGNRLAIELFDLHLASETALLTALDEERSSQEQENRNLAALALARLQRLTDSAKANIDTLPTSAFQREAPPPRLGSAATSDAAAKPNSPNLFRDPAFRLAIQVSLASAIAMAGGLLVSKTRWFWAILTAFLVFVNTQSRGDTALRAFNRAAGTLGGIIAGIALATLLNGALLPSSVLIVAFTFVGFYLLQLSYGALTFCLTIVLSLLYGLLGEFTPALLVVRLEETLIGTLAGTFISFAVFPQKTTATAEKAADAYLSAFDRVLAAADKSLERTGGGTAVLGLARHLDRRLADLAAAARPLGADWWIVRHPGSVRQTLLRFTALTYWTRVFAKGLAACPPDPETKAALRGSIEALRLQTSKARSVRVHFFELATEAARMHVPPRYSAIDAGADDPLFALDVMARLVSRISPDPATVPKE